MQETLPTNWNFVPLEELIEIVMGQAPPGTQCNKDGIGMIFVKTGEFGALRPVVREWTTSPLKYAAAGDVLICVVGATCGKLNLGIDCAIGRSVAALRPNDALEQMYLYYFLTTKVLSLRGDSTGSAQGVIAKSDLAKIEFPTAPLAEQRRIVAKIEELFSELDSGIENLNTVRQQLKAYRQVLIKHAFEGRLTAQWRKENKANFDKSDRLMARIKKDRENDYQARMAQWNATQGQNGSRPRTPNSLTPMGKQALDELPQLPEGWIWEKLGWMTCGVEYGTAAKSAESGAVPVLRMGNIQNARFDWSDLVYTSDEDEICKYSLRDGDVLFNRTNSPELVGKTAIYRGERPALFAGYLIRINQIPTIVDSQYLNLFLSSHVARQHGNRVKTDGVNQSNINGEKLSNYPFPYCSLPEQQEIVKLLDEKLSVVDQLEEDTELEIKKAEALRQSILKRAFSGKLVAQDPTDELASVMLKRVKAERAAKENGKKKTGKWKAA